MNDEEVRLERARILAIERMRLAALGYDTVPQLDEDQAVTARLERFREWKSRQA